jgi:hypothetical protein
MSAPPPESLSAAARYAVETPCEAPNALDILYDLEHSIYAKPQGGVIELAINLLTFTLSAALLRFAWRFRQELLSAQPGAN